MEDSTWTVPDELRGREVSARLLGPMFEGASRLGVRESDLAQGTGCALFVLKNPRQRIAWSAFMAFLQNLGRCCSDEQLIGIGLRQLDSPAYRAILLPGRVLFSLPELYRWGAGAGGPLAKLNVVQRLAVTETAGGRLLFDARIHPDYRARREFWLLRLGFLRSVPCVFGLPLADVSFTETADGGRYEIVLPRDRRLTGRIRQRASWLLAARNVAAELEQANEELHARYLELHREVEARKAAEAKLVRLNAELEERVRLRTRELEASNEELRLFSSSVAHDLRSPLRGINGFAEALIEDHADRLDAEARKKVDRIIAGALRMGDLIDSLLSLSRVTRVEMRRQPIDLGEVARGVVADLRADDPTRAVQVAIEADLIADGDPSLVRLLLENLLGNAWKFTRMRSDARISFGRSGDAFFVRDNGAGFHMEHAQRLFQPFRRLHGPKDFEGTGVGLAIVERIVRRHGGSIRATAAPDHGAMFLFTLSPGTGP